MGWTKSRSKLSMESDAISVRQPVYRPKLFRDLQKTKKKLLQKNYYLSNKEDTLKMKVADVYLRLLKSLCRRVITGKKNKFIE